MIITTVKVLKNVKDAISSTLIELLR